MSFLNEVLFSHTHQVKPRLLPLWLCVVVAALIPTSSRTAVTATVCSLIPFGRLKRDSQPYFIGVAQFDTVLAGPGSKKFKLGQGHFGPARERPIYGQVVHVEKWGGNPPALQVARGTRAIVVPWDYAADCSTTPWGRHWVWLRAGDRMFFTPVLRDREYWVHGYPTFDAFSPQFDAYPVRYEDPVMGRRLEGLTADQLFDLFEQLPSAEEVSSTGWDATHKAAQWANEHSDLASEYPAREIGMTLAWEAGDSHASKINSPLTGTYRFSLTYPNGNERHFFARTSDRPSGAWRIIRKSQDERPAREWLRFPDGYELRLWVAANERELPTEPDWRKRYDHEMGIRELSTSATDSTVWRAEFETSGLYLFKVLKDAELDSLISKHFKWFFDWVDSGTVSPDPGRFVRHADGRITFEQPIPLADSTRVMMRALRLSDRSIRDTACYRQTC